MQLLRKSRPYWDSLLNNNNNNKGCTNGTRDFLVLSYYDL